MDLLTLKFADPWTIWTRTVATFFKIFCVVGEIQSKQIWSDMMESKGRQNFNLSVNRE